MTLELFCFVSGEVLSYSSRADWKGAGRYWDKLGSVGEGGCGAGKETPQLRGRYFFWHSFPGTNISHFLPFPCLDVKIELEVEMSETAQTAPQMTCFAAEGISSAQTLTLWYFIVFVQTVKSHSVTEAVVQARALLVPHRTDTHTLSLMCVYTCGFGGFTYHFCYCFCSQMRWEAQAANRDVASLLGSWE